MREVEETYLPLVFVQIELRNIKLKHVNCFDKIKEQLPNIWVQTVIFLYSIFCLYKIAYMGLKPH